MRPHDLDLRSTGGRRGEAMVDRIALLGFEARVELVRDDGHQLSAQLTRDEVAALRLAPEHTVYVEPKRQTSFAAGPA